MFNLIIKDVKNIVYDKKTLAGILLMPIILMSILGSALKGAFADNGSGVMNAEIVIVKEYNYELEMEKYIDRMKGFGAAVEDLDLSGQFNPEEIFFEKFLGDAETKKMIRYQVVDREKGEQLLRDDEISALIVLPEDFIFNSLMSMTATRNKVELLTIKNAEKQFTADIVEQIMDGYVAMMNKQVVYKMVFIKEADKLGLGVDAYAQLGDLMKNQERISIPIITKEVSGKNSLNSFQYYAVAIMTMFLLYAASLGGKALLDEKKNFTLQRLEVFGNRLGILAMSNFVRVMLIAILQSVVMIMYTSVVLKVNWGDPVTVCVTVLLSAFTVGALGALVAVITLVSDQYFVANAFEFAVVQLMALVGGSFIPVEMLPKPIQNINIIAINGNAIKMFLNGMSHAPMRDNSTYIIALLTMGIVFALSAWLILKTRKGGVIA